MRSSLGSITPLRNALSPVLTIESVRNHMNDDVILKLSQRGGMRVIADTLAMLYMKSINSGFTPLKISHEVHSHV